MIFRVRHADRTAYFSTASLREQPAVAVTQRRHTASWENIRSMGRQSAPRLPVSSPRQQTGVGQLSWASSPAVRPNIQADRGRDTGPEMKLRRLLYSAGFRYRVDWPMSGDRRRRIDIAFPKRKIAIFVDGCFWHRCPAHYVSPKANAGFWDSKIQGNVDRMLGLRPSSSPRGGWSCVSGNMRSHGRWQNVSMSRYGMFTSLRLSPG